jgi:hypothetical protein
MKRAALGIRMHSGWGVLVAVSNDNGKLEIIERRRIVTMDPQIPGAKQPYHFAETLKLAEAEKHIAKCAAVSERLGFAAVEQLLRELDARNYRVAASVIILASGRPLPPLPKILASHPLLHTAEGEFFREAIKRACERLKLSVSAIRERDLDERAKEALGNAASCVQRRISTMGKSIGPPWTKDHKTTALAAAIILQ